MADLHVQVVNRDIIKASDASKEPYTLPPSNFDTFPGPFPALALFVYPKPSNGDFSSVVATVKRTLPEILNYYFPFAGRMSADPKTGAPVIACNNEGAQLVVAHANLPLSSVDFRELNNSIDKIVLPFPGELCFCVQLVSYTCGGFSIIWGSNHLLVDAYTLLNFAGLWAELARTKKVSFIPNHNRSIFKPRTPLRYGPEIERQFRTITLDDMVNVMAADVFVRRRSGPRPPTRRGFQATRMEAFSAYLWKAPARIVGDADPREDGSWIISAFIRPKLAAALDADPQHILKPVTAEYLGFVEPGTHVQLLSRL